MRSNLLDLLGCPTCRTPLSLEAERSATDGDVLDGILRCLDCAEEFPIVRGIPRFVPMENYAASFGYQWNLFRKEQIDSSNGIRQSERRLTTETGWNEEWLEGKWILDAGSGAGRFLEVASRADCQVVGLDISSAVDAARATLGDRPNVHLVQASIFEPPFQDAVFDGVYCIGVIQHTPDPQRAIAALPRVLKPGGEVALTIYERRRFTLLYPKYLIRPLTRRIGERPLLALLRFLMPILFPITEVLFRLPLVGKLFRFMIPIANYVDDPELDLKQRYQWAIMDTFDMLAPAYDNPQREKDVRRILDQNGVTSVERLSNPGLNISGVKA